MRLMKGFYKMVDHFGADIQMCYNTQAFVGYR